jgi:hypothetical protein
MPRQMKNRQRRIYRDSFLGCHATSFISPRRHLSTANYPPGKTIEPKSAHPVLMRLDQRARLAYEGSHSISKSKEEVLCLCK